MDVPGKTKPVSFRVRGELYDRLQHLKNTQAHPRVNDSEFFAEALELYVTLGEAFGLNEDLQIGRSIGPYQPRASQPHAKRAKKGA